MRNGSQERERLPHKGCRTDYVIGRKKQIDARGKDQHIVAFEEDRLVDPATAQTAEQEGLLCGTVEA